MWLRYRVIACGSLALCSSGCEEHGEVVATERSVAAGGGMGDGDGDGDGAAGAPSGGNSGIERPRFLAPTPALGLNDPVAKDQDPSLTADQLEIFFFSDRGENADIWRATRAEIDAAWNPPEPVIELNGPESEQNPAISRDGLRIWYYSSRDPLGIYYAERPSRTEPFSAPEALTISSGGVEGFPIAPALDASEVRMAVSIGTADSRDLFEIVRASPNGTWGDPAPLPGLNTEDYAESTPFLIDSGQEMLFHSGRSGSGDLFWAYREAPGLPFTQIAPLDDVNDPIGFETHPHLTVDGRWLYFGSDRNGNTDIYLAERMSE